MNSLAGIMLYILYIIEIHFSIHYRFFQACMYSAILDNHAEGLRDKLIDVLSACSKRTSEPALFSPAVSNTFHGSGGPLSSGGGCHCKSSRVEHILSHSLTHGAEPFLRSCQLCSHSRNSQHFMEPKSSLSCS
jgi:hypothetical protein